MFEVALTDGAVEFTRGCPRPDEPDSACALRLNLAHQEVVVTGGTDRAAGAAPFWFHRDWTSERHPDAENEGFASESLLNLPDETPEAVAAHQGFVVEFIAGTGGA